MEYITTVELIAAILAYATGIIATITASGFTQAWITKKYGDNTLEKAGLLSYNPSQHIKPFEFII
jgi:hypothetical protein